MEPGPASIDIDNKLQRRIVRVIYKRVKCRLISGKWFIQLDGFHDMFSIDDAANPPFEDGEMVKVTLEGVVQDVR